MSKVNNSELDNIVNEGPLRCVDGERVFVLGQDKDSWDLEGEKSFFINLSNPTLSPRRYCWAYMTDDRDGCGFFVNVAPGFYSQTFFTRDIDSDSWAGIRGEGSPLVYEKGIGHMALEMLFRIEKVKNYN